MFNYIPKHLIKNILTLLGGCGASSGETASRQDGDKTNGPPKFKIDPQQ